ncbi:hypothetical protein TNCV_1694611 [Trichonephila clavipes]|nr:hypothetical protein TNCV_1694611 [Trichonephila clavipes]
MIWGTIKYTPRTALIHIDGTLNSGRYISRTYQSDDLTLTSEASMYGAHNIHAGESATFPRPMISGLGIFEECCSQRVDCKSSLHERNITQHTHDINTHTLRSVMEHAVFCHLKMEQSGGI